MKNEFDEAVERAIVYPTTETFGETIARVWSRMTTIEVIKNVVGAIAVLALIVVPLAM